jgi:acyl-CoA reductase-like NAD-dependent aldehyde dehydrogenase
MCTVMSERVVQSSDGSHIFRMAGNRWRMNLVEAGQFPFGPMKKWSLGVAKEGAMKSLETNLQICSKFVAHSEIG